MERLCIKYKGERERKRMAASVEREREKKSGFVRIRKLLLLF